MLQLILDPNISYFLIKTDVYLNCKQFVSKKNNILRLEEIND